MHPFEYQMSFAAHIIDVKEVRYDTDLAPLKNVNSHKGKKKQFAAINTSIGCISKYWHNIHVHAWYGFLE